MKVIANHCSLRRRRRHRRRPSPSPSPSPRHHRQDLLAGWRGT